MDGGGVDGGGMDGGGLDGGELDGGGADGGGMDGGGADAVPEALAVIDTEPPLLGWRRGERIEVVPFDRVTGPGEPFYRAPVGAVDGRFAGRGARWVVGYGLDGDAWIGPAPRRVAVGVAMRGVAVVAGGVVALVGDADPAMARLVRVDDASGEVVERRFGVEPDASELLGLAGGGGELVVLTGDWRAGALWVHRFDEALAPLGRERVCDLGCDRPGARVVGGPVVAVVHQAVGQVHLTVGGEARAVGDAVRGTLLAARWDEGWLAAWTRPVAAPEGVVVAGARVAEGAVRSLGLVAGGCVVWAGEAVAWWCAAAPPERGVKEP